VFDSVQSIQDPKIDQSLRDHMMRWQNDPAAADFLSVQILKVNVLKDLSLFSNRLLPPGRHDLLSGASKWQRLVQLCEYVWIPSTAVLGLSFVFPATDDGELVSHTFDDCRGMSNVYLLQHRMDSAGVLSSVPHGQCPPFPCYLESFRKVWSIDYSQMVFNGIRQIRQSIQQSLCRVAQSQGDYSVKKIKLQLPNCCWLYIRDVLTSSNEIRRVSTVTYSKPKAVLSWGLTLHCSAYVGSLDVIRVDTKEKMEAFRHLFGIMAGFGVRKRRPTYCEGKAVLSLNDVLNIISPPSHLEAENNHLDDCQLPFKLVGVTGDGIDLAYDAAEGVLQVSLRYRKMVVTNASLPSLASVGVVAADSPSRSLLADDARFDIIPGMEFMDDVYIMQVQAAFGDEVHAKRAYKIVYHQSGQSRTIRLDSSETVIYTDKEYVYRQIQEMLE
jgi:hypothetical protein